MPLPAYQTAREPTHLQIPFLCLLPELSRPDQRHCPWHLRCHRQSGLNRCCGVAELSGQPHEVLDHVAGCGGWLPHLHHLHSRHHWAGPARAGKACGVRCGDSESIVAMAFNCHGAVGQSTISTMPQLDLERVQADRLLSIKFMAGLPLGRMQSLQLPMCSTECVVERRGHVCGG